MTARFRTLLKHFSSVALALLFLYLAFRDVDISGLWASMGSADYWWMFLMLLLLLGSHILRSLRWRYLLEPIKAGIGLRSLFSGVMLGYLVNNVLPRAGELVRPYAIGRLESISKSAALGTIVVERIMDGVSFLILLALMPLVYDGPLREVFPWLGESGIIMSAVLLSFLIVAVVLMVRRDWTTRLVGFAERILPGKSSLRIHRVVHSFLDGFLFLKQPRKYPVIVLLSAGVWFLYIAMMHAAFVAFHLQHQLGWRAAVVVLAISSIGVALPTPGSTGSYHFFTAQTLTRLFFVPEKIALGYATLTHAVGYVGVSIIGLYFLYHDHIKVSDAVRNHSESAP